MAEIYLSIGSNLGDRVRNLYKAVSMLTGKVQLRKISSFYQTIPVDYLEQPNFINMACSLETDLEPLLLLCFLKEIEIEMGRKPSVPMGPRIIDLDILLYDSQVIESANLTIPHSLMLQRAFVLVPLAEIAPDLVHPLARLNISSLLESLGPVHGVDLLHDPLEDGRP